MAKNLFARFGREDKTLVAMAIERLNVVLNQTLTFHPDKQLNSALGYILFTTVYKLQLFL